MKSIVILAAAACVPVLIWCQDQPRFSSHVQLVMLDVQVTEKVTGRVIDLLGPKDFEVFDNAVQQEVREFHFETTLVDAVFLRYGVPAWRSAKEYGEIIRGFHEAVDELRPGDRGGVLCSDSESKVDVPMTGDKDEIRRGLLAGGSSRVRSGTHLYDAVKAATTLFPRPRDFSRRRAIIAITNDIEKGSRIKIDPLIDEILEAGATLNEVVIVVPSGKGTVGASGPLGIPQVWHRVGSDPTGDSLRTAVQATGGEAIPGDLFRQKLPELIRRIRQRYLLGFYAAPASAREFHKIEVRLTLEAKKQYPNALIRARRGYYSQPAPMAGNEARAGLPGQQ